MNLDFKYVPLDDALCSYVRENRTHAKEDDVLSQLRKETRKFGRLAVMQIPDEQGAFLRMVVSMIGARRAFEVGTFTGYSSICIASGLGATGHLTTCDTNAEFAEVARKYWKTLSIEKRVTFEHREALAYIRMLPRKRTLDFAFVDADRLHSRQYFEELVHRVVVGGVIIFDNMLAKGQIATGTSNTIRERDRLNRLAAVDPRVEALIVPIGDGMLMCRVVK